MRAWPRRVSTRVGKSCRPDPFSTLSPHLKALRKTIFNLVDSSHPILFSPESHNIIFNNLPNTYDPSLYFFFRKQQMVWGRTGNSNSGNRLIQAGEAARMSLIFPSHHQILSWTTIHNFLDIRRDLMTILSWHMVPRGCRWNPTLTAKNRHRYRLHRHYIHLQISSRPRAA